MDEFYRTGPAIKWDQKARLFYNNFFLILYKKSSQAKKIIFGPVFEWFKAFDYRTKFVPGKERFEIGQSGFWIVNV
jgi:hypothetical protein